MLTLFLFTVLVFFISATIHELGHYIAIRKLGYPVISISVGCGPEIFSFFGITYYLFPIGGRVIYNDGGITQSDRVFAHIAGPMASILFSSILMLALPFCHGLLFTFILMLFAYSSFQACLSLIPFDGNDGNVVWDYKRSIYFSILAPSIVLSIYAFTLIVFNPLN